MHPIPTEAAIAACEFAVSFLGNSEIRASPRDLDSHVR